MYARTYNRYTAQALTNGIIRIFATETANKSYEQDALPDRDTKL